jgi:hypothetical protein
MDPIGIDVHKNASQVCIRTEAGQLIERRIRTDRESFSKLLEKPTGATHGRLAEATFMPPNDRRHL